MPKRRAENECSGPELHSAKRARPGRPWASLPAEIRLLILCEISRQKLPGWASCAAVCKEWQDSVEPENFRRLRIKASCLEEFQSVVFGRRHLVEYISFNVELPRYDCDSCRKEESLSRQSRSRAICRAALQKLFLALSIWQPTGRLVLDLNVYSPSDQEHWFQSHCLGLEEDDGYVGDSLPQGAAHWTRHDPVHGWECGRQFRPPCVLAAQRLSTSIDFDSSDNLPEVHAVTKLAIRRQVRRQLRPSVLEQLWRSLPRLESVVYEPWRDVSAPWDVELHEYGRDVAKAIRDDLPSNVRTLSIFEDFHEQLGLDGHISSVVVNSTPAVGDALLARVLAGRSRSLEHLSVSHLINAQQIFDGCRPSYTWQYLKSLALTASILTQATPPEEISALLLHASSVARRMPQLEIMALWNSQRQEACAVIYLRNKASRQPTLTWRGTWDFELSRGVVQSWQEVAPDVCDLQVENERISSDINSHGDAIYHLRLPVRVIDPVSLWQIREEGMLPGWPRNKWK